MTSDSVLKFLVVPGEKPNACKNAFLGYLRTSNKVFLIGECKSNLGRLCRIIFSQIFHVILSEIDIEVFTDTVTCKTLPFHDDLYILNKRPEGKAIGWALS